MNSCCIPYLHDEKFLINFFLAGVFPETTRLTSAPLSGVFLSSPFCAFDAVKPSGHFHAIIYQLGDEVFLWQQSSPPILTRVLAPYVASIPSSVGQIPLLFICLLL